MIFSPALRPSLTCDQSARSQAELDLVQLDGVVVAHHPDAGGVAVVDDGVARHGGRGTALVDEDGDVGEHFRLEQAFPIVDRGPHQQTPRVRIERRVDIVDLGIEYAIRDSRHGEIDALAELHARRLGFAHEGGQPDGREIADDEHRIARSGADILAGPDLALHHRAADRCVDRRIGADLARSARTPRSPRRCGRACAAGCAPPRAPSRPSARRSRRQAARLGRSAHP